MRAWLSRRRLKAIALVAGTSVTGLLLATMFASELTRIFVKSTAAAPVALPSGVDIRYSDRLVAIIGRGTPSGKANAVTLGSLILVTRQFDRMPVADRRDLIRHELVHTAQRERYGPFYLPLYGVLYVLHGYADHPFEREAVRIAGAEHERGRADGL